MMKLTEEQEEVVSVSSGRHLVLAPPGSGKTEMLSQRIVRALEAGVDPNRMLCATFTNRAAFEMRDRVGRSGRTVLPDVGNLHHFCYRFLLSVRRIRPNRHVLDEVEQVEFLKEVADVLRDELRDGRSRFGEAHGVEVARMIEGVENEARRKYLSGRYEAYFAACLANGASPYPDLLTGALVSHQVRIGIPLQYRHPMPVMMYGLAKDGILSALAAAYTGLKRRFRCLDFDDLLNETFLWLERNPLEEERRFEWVQIDEVQDLSPMQWRIVMRWTAVNAVSVYFGDVEQAIFSFLGASSGSFADATSDCVRHYFKTNFRATPVLLEVLMRYSIDALASGWEFLPVPASNATESKLFLAEERSAVSVVSHVKRLLSTDTAENVAILVHTNIEADVYEEAVRALGYRYAKVSGLDLFSYVPMRDYLAYVSLFNGTTTRNDWARLFRRFARGVRTISDARYLVREMYACGGDPMGLLSGEFRRQTFRNPRLLSFWCRRCRALESLRAVLRRSVKERLCGSFRSLFEAFREIALTEASRYELHELMPGKEWTERSLADPQSRSVAVAFAEERVERFLRYTDHVYASDQRPFPQILKEDWDKLRKLKESDLLVGDEKIVISTVHKAKGRQFDAVVVPGVAHLLSASSGDDEQEASRLLYVAMSRAKRHLSLLGVDRRQPQISCIANCFAPGYVCYYLQPDERRRADDWLWLWERLAAMNERSSFDAATVDDFVRIGNASVARMAVKCCRHCGDEVVLRKRLLEVVAKTATRVLDGHSGRIVFGGCWEWTNAAVARSLSSCCQTAVECLRECRIFDEEAVAVVRCAALCAKSCLLSRSVFDYLCAAVKDESADARIRSGTVALRGGSGKRARSAVGDFLYSRFPSLRFAAAMALAEFGDGRWIGRVTGSGRDFDYLASVPDPEREDVIRMILRNGLPETYESRLREILQIRARRGSGYDFGNQIRRVS